MPFITYTKRRFADKTLQVISQANGILEEYASQGFTITLRQLYYQFVARGLIPNTDKSYNRLGSIINGARLAGLIDWNHLIDRTRNVQSRQHFEGAEHALRRLAAWYHVDLWKRQRVRPEVWIEKDALVGVIEGVCQELDVPFFSCRGYTSQSEMWAAGQRLLQHQDDGYHTYIVHLGDHDPSGIDMSRDIFDRLALFMGGTDFVRIALNMNQVERYRPPPNPAKVTDSRAATYIRQYGRESWELDALDPATMADLIRSTIEPLRDDDTYQEDLAHKEDVKQKLARLAQEWDESEEAG